MTPKVSPNLRLKLFFSDFHEHMSIMYYSRLSLQQNVFNYFMFIERLNLNS